MKIAIGITSGLGNGVYMLPAIKALALLGHQVVLHVATDFPTLDVWKRCIHAEDVVPAHAAVNGTPAYCGPYYPQPWQGVVKFTQMRLQQIHQCEWRSNLRIAELYGWHGKPPDVSDWCRDLDRTPKWDVGIINTSKPGPWLRKRWPAMSHVANHFVRTGKKVAVFGLEGDEISGLAGEQVDTRKIAALPDALAGCKVVIGTDTGPAHLASSLGVPTVMVYTATSEIKAEPVCQPNIRIRPEGLHCYPCVSTPKWQACKAWYCHRIDPWRVIRAAEELLNA